MATQFISRFTSIVEAILNGFGHDLEWVWEHFWPSLEGLGDVLKSGFDSLWRKVVAEGSWRAIWKDFVSTLGGFGLYFGRFLGF